MKEKWTKLGKSLICLALVTSMLAGCGGGGNSSSSSEEQTSGGTSGEVAAGDDNFNETGLPIVKEPVELTFLYVKGANTMDFKDNAMFQQMEKDTNVKINWQYAGDADWSEQKSLLLASGDLPDVFFGDNALKDNDIATNLDMFIPLEDYVEKYCPNIQAAWEAEPTMRQMVTNPDGHIYTLPGKKPLRPKGCDTPFINKAWLDRLGLEMPTTVDEWYEVLKAFKETDCNGNGQMDEIPLLINSTSGYMHFEAWLGMWGIPCKDSTYDSYLVVQDGVVKFAPLMDEYKDFLKFMNKLYSEGLIYNECFTATSAMVQSLLDSPDAAFGVVTTKSLNTNADQYICIEPPTVEGYTPKWYYHPGFMGVKCNFMITDKCDDPQTLMAWIDRYYNPELAFQTMYGPEGIVFDKVDGKFVAKEPPTGVSFQQLAQDNVMEYTGGPGVLYSENFGTLFDLTESQIAGQTAYGVYEKFLNDEVWPRPYLQAEQVSRAGQLRTDIFNTVSQMKAKWITGEADIDATYDQFKSDLEKMGIEEFVSIYQSAYDAFNSAMNG